MGNFKVLGMIADSDILEISYAALKTVGHFGKSHSSKLGSLTIG